MSEKHEQNQKNLFNAAIKIDENNFDDHLTRNLINQTINESSDSQCQSDDYEMDQVFIIYYI